MGVSDANGDGDGAGNGDGEGDGDGVTAGIWDIDGGDVDKSGTDAGAVLLLLSFEQDVRMTSSKSAARNPKIRILILPK